MTATTSNRYKWQVAAVIAGSMMFAGIDVGGALVALPTIAADFDADLPAVQWVALMRLLGLSALLLPAGRVADLVGRKKVALTGIVVLGAGGVLAALAPTLPLLIAARGLQSLAEAALQASGPAILIAAFPANQRGTAMGINTTSISIGAVAGLVIGGIVAETLGWRYVFVIPSPVMLIAAVAGFRYLRERPVVARARMDLAGASLLVLWMVPLFFFMTRGRVLGWLAPEILGALAVVLVAASVFTYVQRRRPHALVSPALLRNRVLMLTNGVAALDFVGMGGFLLLGPFLLQLHMELDPSASGLLIAAVPVGIFLTAPLGGLLTDRIGHRMVRTAGLIVEGGAFLAISLLATDPQPWSMVAAFAGLGFGHALFQPANATTMLGSVTTEQTGLAAGFMALSRTFGQALGQAILGTLFAAIIMAGGAPSALEAGGEVLAGGFRIAFAGAAAALFLGAIFSRLIPARFAPPPDSTPPLRLHRDDFNLGWPAGPDRVDTGGRLSRTTRPIETRNETPEED